MANSFVHPERALTLSTRQSKTTATPTESPVPAEPLSPGAEAARKERINQDMMELLNVTTLDRRQPPNTKASAQGVGLYTHTSVLGSFDGKNAQRPSPPEFLPLGGPLGILTLNGMSQEHLSEEMEKIWKQAEATIIEEEKLVQEASMSEEQLRQRYGTLNVPDLDEAAVAQAQKQLQVQQFMEAVRKLQAQRISVDVAKGGTDSGGDVGASVAPGAHPHPKANMYHESRDPRRRG